MEINAVVTAREMAVGNTFGATALSSYGGFWISYAILMNPSWKITGSDSVYSATATGGDPEMLESALGFFLTGWFIFTTILLLCTLRSTVMFFLLFFTLDITFLLLACGAFATNNGATNAATKVNKAAGLFGLLSAFLAWYNAFAGMADSRSVWSLVFSRCCPMLTYPPILATLLLSSPSSTFLGPRRATKLARRPARRRPNLSLRSVFFFLFFGI